MSLQQRKLLWLALILVAATVLGLFWVSARAKTESTVAGMIDVSVPQIETTSQSSTTAASRPDLRSSLSRQPEVSRLKRIIGQRLNGKNKSSSTLVGTLTIGTDEQRIQIVRRQNDDGEALEVFIGNRRDPLTWSTKEGAKSSGETLTEKERYIIERLTRDSPDQFVLAQLRGASYYTITHNVRPDEAGGSDDYTGPTWDIVRVTEVSTAKGVPGEWRLYYLNTTTNLIDRIVSQEQDEMVVAEISRWTEVGGEKLPSRITWSRRGQVVMQYQLTNFLRGNQQ